MHALLGWPLWVALIVAAAIVLSYITLGGLSAAIYNEVLQFFVIVASLLPLTLLGLHRVGGWDGLTDKITAAAGKGGAAPADQQLNSWPGQALSGFDSSLLSVVGIVFGLGFVLSFGYWTTNFVEVQRAMASDSISSARKTPIIGAFPKMFVPFITIVPGHDRRGAGHRDRQGQGGRDRRRAARRATGSPTTTRCCYLMRDLLPNGLLGLAIAGLLAAFMAGMAANISAFNTVFSYDLWGDYVVKDRDDDYYLRVGRIATVGATVIAIFTAGLAANFSNIMNYLQTLFGFFNAPLFATFILGMFWKRMTADGRLGGPGRPAPLSAVAVAFLSRGRLRLAEHRRRSRVGGQGAAFLAASAAFVVDVVLSIVVSLVTKPKPADGAARAWSTPRPRGRTWSTPNEASYPWYRRTLPLAGVALVMVIVLNVAF